ncbi:aspartic proteinase nepenthesin-1-like [Melia azedarach]|uniref:Aspartic proteinase nepenthesin-1-like n=1 Tax=Melia azedarach TaxID=155640 RepID=A0ACC1XWP2_MELAZ|nr:aspartic proteinase nepenthesin-1-like [Melia azedarach]
MASTIFSSSSSSAVLLALAVAIIALCVAPAVCTSRQPPDVKTVGGFRIKLKSVDFGKNLSTFERVARGMKRGQLRLQRLNALMASLAEDSDSSADVEAPVHAGTGEFLMDLSIGSPSVSYSAILDTGSDLIWTQCKPCKDCFTQSTPIFDPFKSSSFSKLPCSSSLCEALPQSACSSSSNDCEYLYTYGDYSSTQGIMATETFKFGKVSVPNIGFGCGSDNEGDGFTQGAGLVGLGRGPLSLVSQLKEPKFSYCLTSIDDGKASTLLMGSLASNSGSSSKSSSSSSSSSTTPLIKNPSQPSFYYLSLEGISVGGTRLPIDKSTFTLKNDGTGGIIIDSGTTITYLEDSAYEALRKEFISQTKLTVVNESSSVSTGLDLCFNLPSSTDSIEVPKLVFHFEGADLDLPSENYMIADTTVGMVCLAMGSSSGMSIFGNIQQQNILMLHDLEKETLTFIPAQCDSL